METEKYILLVDNYYPMDEIFRQFFRFKGYEITAAPDVRTALEKINDKNYEAAVVDSELPDGTVVEVISKLKERCPKAKVFVTTLNLNTSLRKSVNRFNVNAVLEKPFRLDTLANMITSEK
jgi:DNA-binding NtrC family response regulator